MEPRIPPKFVPTLTEVVAFDEDVQEHIPSAAQQASAPWRPEPHLEASAGWVDTIDADPARGMGGGLSANLTQADGKSASADTHWPAGFEEDVAQRVLQRVQVTLHAQLARAVDDVIRHHTQAMLAPLSEKVEAVVRDTVAQAVQQQLDSYK